MSYEYAIVALYYGNPENIERIRGNLVHVNYS